MNSGWKEAWFHNRRVVERAAEDHCGSSVSKEVDPRVGVMVVVMI